MNLKFLGASIALAGLIAVALTAQQTKVPEDRARWVLTFSEDFDGPDLDLFRWSTHDPFGRERDRELQAYVPEAVTVSDGELHLNAAALPAGEPVKYAGRDREYQSGIVTTYGLFAQAFGRFEIRCRIPRGQGLRPGFRLLPVPSGSLPGINVFEAAGGTPSRIFFANRWGTERTERSFGDSFTVADLSTTFHTIGVEWSRNRIVWSVDGKEHFQSVDGIPQQAMYLVIDLAVGGTLAHAPDESTQFPASFDIDYIRVYRRP